MLFQALVLDDFGIFGHSESSTDSQDLQNHSIKDAKTIREDVVETQVSEHPKAESSTCGASHH